MTGEELRRHLQALQAVADENEGNRAVGSTGYARSLDYVTSTLEELGPRISWRRQLFFVAINQANRSIDPVFRLAVQDAADFVQGLDFDLMSNSGFGTVKGLSSSYCL